VALTPHGSIGAGACKKGKMLAFGPSQQAGRETAKSMNNTSRIAPGLLLQACARYTVRIVRAAAPAVLFTVPFVAEVTHGQNATWLAEPTSPSWDASANWTPATVPTGVATFGASDTTSITFITYDSIGALQFNAGAPAYSFSFTKGNGLAIDGVGVINNSANKPTFSITSTGLVGLFFTQASTAANSVIKTSNGGIVEFGLTSTAGTATISNTGSGITKFANKSTAASAVVTNSGEGETNFYETSTAGNAVITNTGEGFTNFYNTSTAGNAAIINGNNGETQFFNTSTAGSSAITVNSRATLAFSDAATAGTASITNSDGRVQFNDSSSGGTAAITTNSGGSTLFVESSTGGRAHFITNAGGSVDISALSTDGMTAGSIEGAGTYQLGSKRLTVGLNNLSTVVSGTIADGGVAGGTGGTLVKTGAGTLTLSGANTYSGGTIISAGTLQIGGGGTSGSIAGNVTDNATLAFSRSDPFTFGGVITGAGTLVQIGSNVPETLTLTAANTYTGATVINIRASLQLGNGGTTGSIIGNVIDNGSLIFNRSDTVSYNGIISGSGIVVQDGQGTTILGGTNTLTRAVDVNNGTLLISNAQALGRGNVVVNGGTLGVNPQLSDTQTINVNQAYTQNGSGTLQLRVAGPDAGDYDSLNVGAVAFLGGTLRLVPIDGFEPYAGDKLTVVTSAAGINGKFDDLESPFVPGSGFNTIDLVYGRNSKGQESVEVDFLELGLGLGLPVPTEPGEPALFVTTIDFTSFALTPNELAAANLLNAVQLDPRVTNLMTFLENEPFANLPADFDKISPEALTAFYEIGFSNANIERLTLEDRLNDIQNGSNGFSSNLNLSGTAVYLEDKSADEGKSSKSVVEPVLQRGIENRWGVWATGFGDFVSVDGDANANGYNFTTGGVSLGIDYRVTDQLAIGVMGGYSHTWTNLEPNGDIEVDGGRGGLYATWFDRGAYLDGGIYGGYETYDSARGGLGGLASGSTHGAEWSAFASTGYDFRLAQLSLGPIASLQSTYVDIHGFSEQGSLAPMQIHSDSARSLRTDLGFRAIYQWKIGKIILEPSIKAAWEHEYLYSALPITAGIAAVPGPSETFFGPSEGHDSAVVSAGISAQWAPAISTYIDYDGQLGRGLYDSNAVTGGVRFSF
jgi:outer membrane autotransporter protein